MSVIEIVEAEREGARLVFGFCGPSGCGKTYTALQFAYGLANYEATKVGLLDTENRRGRLYSDILKRSTKPTDKRFMRGDLYAPFSPSRYIDAIQQFQAAGVEVLVIDSATHEWEGIGGCQEIAEGNNPRMPNWNKAKSEHKKFMNAALTCDMHIIFCVRAREKSVPEKNDQGKVVFRDLGMQPIQEKNFMFEMTASLMLYNQGTEQDVLKCPDVLQAYLGRRRGHITADDGAAVRAWVDGAKMADPQVEKFRNRLLSNTEPGLKHIEACWDKTPAEIRTELGDAFKTQIFAAAKAFDGARAQAAGFGPEHGGDTKTAIFAAGSEAPAQEQQQTEGPQEKADPPQPQATAPKAEARKPEPPKPAAKKLADPVF